MKTGKLNEVNLDATGTGDSYLADDGNYKVIPVDDIATNTTDIATNAANITTNTTDIAT